MKTRTRFARINTHVPSLRVTPFHSSVRPPRPGLLGFVSEMNGAPTASTWQSVVHGKELPFVSGHNPPGAGPRLNTTAEPVFAVGR